MNGVSGRLLLSVCFAAQFCASASLRRFWHDQLTAHAPRLGATVGYELARQDPTGRSGPAQSGRHQLASWKGSLCVICTGTPRTEDVEAASCLFKPGYMTLHFACTRTTPRRYTKALPQNSCALLAAQ